MRFLLNYIKFFQKNTTLILALICLVLFAAFAVFAHYDSDDFILVHELTHYGIFNYGWLTYQNWDGRALSVSSILQSGLLRYASPWLVVLCWQAFFVATVYLVLSIVQQQALKVKKSKTIVELAVWIGVFWLGNFINVADTLYWCTGGVYTLNLFLLFLWIYLFNTLCRAANSLSVFSQLAFGVFTLLLAQSSAQIGAALLVALLVAFYKHKTIKRYVVGWAIWLLAGSIITILAPGNFKRATHTPRGFDTDSVIYNAVVVLGKYTLYGLLLFFLMIAVSRLVYGSKRLQGNFVQQFWTIIRGFVFNHPYFLMGLASVSPLFVLPDFAGHRPSVIFLWLTALQLLATAMPENEHRTALRNMPTLSLILVFMVSLLIQLGLNSRFQAQLKVREQYLLAHRGRQNTIEISPIPLKTIPFSYKHFDITNAFYAQYYGYDTILINGDTPRPEYFRTHLHQWLRPIKAQE